MLKRRWLNSALMLCTLMSFIAAPRAHAEEKNDGEKKLEAGYKKGGFYIQSPDEKYKMVFGGYAQFHLEYERINGENDFTFRVRRARLSWSGNLFGKDFTYKFQIELAKKSPQLLDAYVDYKIFGENFRVEVGQFKIPFVRQDLVSSSSQMFIDRSLASKFFLPDVTEGNADDGYTFLKDGRDIGIMLHGTPFEKKLEYQVAAFNGSGINNANFNNELLYVGRLVYNIKGYVGYELEGDFDYTADPAIFIGASANYNVRDVLNDDVVTFGSEAGVKYKGFAATGEFFYRFTDLQNDTQDLNDLGYYLQASYFFIPKRLEVALRASQIFFDGPDNNKGEYQFGINGYIYDTRLKVQADYSLLTTDTDEDTRLDNRFRLRLQLKL